MRVGRVSAVLALTACAGERLPLSDVPILGGTPEQQAAVQSELAAFDQFVGPGRLQISAVRFRAKMPKGAAGAHHVNTAKIDLDLTLQPGGLLEFVLRHELCHAIDHAEGLVAPRSELWDSLADTVARAITDLSIDAEVSWSPRFRRSEAFASFCSLGPVVSDLLSDPCPDDPAVGGEVGEFLNERLWRINLPDPVPASDVPEVSLDLQRANRPEYIDADLDTLAWGAPGVASLTDFTTILFFDLYSGQVVEYPEPCCAVQDQPEKGTPDNQPLWFTEHGGWLNGPAGGIGWADLIYLPPSGPRAYWSDGEEWHRVAGACPPWADDYGVLGADDVIWVFTRQGSVLSWSPMIDAAQAGTSGG